MSPTTAKRNSPMDKLTTHTSHETFTNETPTGPQCAKSKYVSGMIFIPLEPLATGGLTLCGSPAALGVRSGTNAETTLTPPRTRVS